MVGASALEFDPYAGRFDAWDPLPYLQDPAFPAAPAEVLKRRGVTQIAKSGWANWAATTRTA